MRKEQQRAQLAYNWAADAMRRGCLPDYKIAVQTFAATLLQAGLAVAASVLERDAKDGEAARMLLGHFSQVAAPAPIAAEAWLGAGWPTTIRAMALPEYRMRSRDLRAQLAWLVRACRAIEPPERSVPS